MISVQALAFSIIALASLPNGHPIASFRAHELGPEGRAEQLAGFITEASSAYRVDPSVLAALAWEESRFDGTRIGKARERSIMQLHPRWPLGKAYNRFRGTQAERDRFSLFLGAEGLRHGLKICHTLPAALGWYRSGRCVAGPRARQVMIVRARILRYSGVSHG